MRLIPWGLVMVLTGGVFMLLLANFFSLFGIETGQGFMRR